MKLTLCCVVLSLSTPTFAFAQEPAPPTPTPPAKTAAPTDAALAKLVAAKDDAERDVALVAFMRAQIATGAVYAGQYDALRELVDVVGPRLQQWCVEAPAKVSNEDEFREACVRSLRDLYQAEAPPELVKTLQTIRADEFEASRVKSAALFALAQFGDREQLTAMIEKLTAESKHEDARHRVAAFGELADAYYNLRDFAKASAAYGEMLALHESGAVDLAKAGQQVPTIYYNAACSATLAGDKDKAFAWLERALEPSKSRAPLPRSLLDTDRDIAALRDDPRFAELMQKHFSGGLKPTTKN